MSRIDDDDDLGVVGYLLIKKVYSHSIFLRGTLKKYSDLKCTFGVFGPVFLCNISILANKKSP